MESEASHKPTPARRRSRTARNTLWSRLPNSLSTAVERRSLPRSHPSEGFPLHRSSIGRLTAFGDVCVRWRQNNPAFVL